MAKALPPDPAPDPAPVPPPDPRRDVPPPADPPRSSPPPAPPAAGSPPAPPAASPPPAPPAANRPPAPPAANRPPAPPAANRPPAPPPPPALGHPQAGAGLRSAALAQALQQRIVGGGIEVGRSLPSERELMVEYAVSRATVREALRALGATGLIEARRGRRGGSYVCRPGTESVSRSLDLFIRGSNLSFAHLVAAREAIEPAAAAQAALSRTAEDLDRLHALAAQQAEALDDVACFTATNFDWHLAIVRASHNPLFVSFMASIAAAFQAATQRDEFDLGRRRLVVRVHGAILRAVVAGDAAAARRRMLRHVTAYAATLDLGRSSP